MTDPAQSAPSAEVARIPTTRFRKESFEESDKPFIRCANCGQCIIAGTGIGCISIGEGEAACSNFCADEHERLGCPQESGAGYRDAKWYAEAAALRTAQQSDKTRILEEGLKRIAVEYGCWTEEGLSEIAKEYLKKAEAVAAQTPEEK